jgi:hypothetical protein
MSPNYYRMPPPKPAESSTSETMLLVGGLSLMFLGAGLVLTNPTVRRYLGQASIGGVGDLVQMALPDLERYLKIRSL